MNARHGLDIARTFHGPANPDLDALSARCHAAQIRARDVTAPEAIAAVVAELRAIRDALEEVNPVTMIGHARKRHMRARIWRALETLGGNPE